MLVSETSVKLPRLSQLVAPVTSASTGMPLAATRSWTYNKVILRGQKSISPLSLLSDLKVLQSPILKENWLVVCAVCGVKVVCFVQSRPSAFVN